MAFGSHAARTCASPVRASSRVQATRSAAIWVSINQVVLIAKLPRREPAQPRLFGVPDAVLEWTIEAKVVPCVLGSLTFASVTC